MKKGKMIVIAGTDGSGKKTQTKLLVERLHADGHKVKTIDFPRYGQKSAGLVEEYLNGLYGTSAEVGPYRASIFYAVDRYVASLEMKKWLDGGFVVIADRYVSANKGHQASKFESVEERDKYLAWLDNLEYELFGIPREDLNILLFVSAETSQKLVDRKEARVYTDKKRDLHEADLNHLRRAANSYREVAEKEGWGIIVCEKGGEIMPIEEIHEMVYKKAKEILEEE